MADDPSFTDWMKTGAVPMPDSSAQGRLSSAGGGGVLPADSGEADAYDNNARFAQNGISDKRVRQLRAADAEMSLDLHGETVQGAYELLDNFLAEALMHRRRVVEVVHGRGQHSADGRGVLRARVRKWLAHCSVVLAYVEPPKNNGAVLVLLRRSG